MKYYKIDIKSHFPELGRIASGAEGKNVPEKEYFYRIGKREIIENTPIFDYFVLKSFDKEKYWEWALFDIHNFIGVGSIMCGWYISDKLKSLLEKFKIAPKYHFYETRLLYKEEKFKYWIFQFPIDYFQNVNHEKSFYSIPDENILLNFKNKEEFLAANKEEFRKTKRELITKKICYLENYDLVANDTDILCSEHLKQAIEENGIIGFEFFEIDYEVVAE